MTFLDNLSPEDLLILTNVIAVSLSESKTTIEINVIGNFVESIGCLMLTIAAQQEYLNTLQENNNTNNNSNQQNTNNSTTTPDDTII